MPKKKTKKSNYLFALVGVIFVIASIAFLAAPAVGLYGTAFGETGNVGDPISGFDFFFNGLTGGNELPEGLSNLGPYPGLMVAFVLLCLGALLPLIGVALGLVKLRKGAGIVELLGGAIAIVGGVMSLLALTIAGLQESVGFGNLLSYRFELEWGIWLTGIVAILGGISSAIGGAINVIK